MTDPEPYASAAAVEAAIRDAARRAAAADPSSSVSDGIRQECFNRFEYIQHRPAIAGDQQAYTEGFRVGFEVYVGASSRGRVHVDLVSGVLVTGKASVQPPANALPLPRLPSRPYRLYPIVDQIADKVCATMALYGGKPSSREKDLVDLVVIAATEDVDARDLQRAIAAEAGVRQLPSFSSLEIPDTWGAVYAREAGRVSVCEEFQTVSLAADLMRRFIDPVLSGSAAGGTWRHTDRRWVAAS